MMTTRLENTGRACSTGPGESIRLAWRINDACKALGVSRSHIYDLAAAGKLRLVKIGGRTVIPDDEIRRIAREGA
jgi:excisionase family DNA binding protein